MSHATRVNIGSNRTFQKMKWQTREAGHVVLNVAPGGKTYTVAYVTADDESMTVRGAYYFA